MYMLLMLQICARPGELDAVDGAVDGGGGAVAADLAGGPRWGGGGQEHPEASGSLHLPHSIH